MDHRPATSREFDNLVWAGFAQNYDRYKRAEKKNNSTINNTNKPAIIQLIQTRRMEILLWFHAVYKKSYSAEPSSANLHFPHPEFTLEEYKHHMHARLTDPSARLDFDSIFYANSYVRCFWFFLWSQNQPHGHENQLCDLLLIFSLFKPDDFREATLETINERFGELLTRFAPIVHWLRSELSPDSWEHSFVPEILGLREARFQEP